MANFRKTSQASLVSADYRLEVQKSTILFFDLVISSNYNFEGFNPNEKQSLLRKTLSKLQHPLNQFEHQPNANLQMIVVTSIIIKLKF